MMQKKDLRIVFLGTPDFAVESLRRMLDDGCNVVGVVTMPDKPAGRGKQLRPSAVKEFAVSRGLKVMQPERLKDPAFVDELRALRADLFVVIAFRMLPEVVWQMPPLGTFNLHASLLPRYRGAAPINWAVINGDTRTGVTTFFLKHEIDTGDIIDREAIDIAPDDNAGTIHDRLMLLGADLVARTIDRIVDGSLQPIPQDRLDDGVEPAPAPKIFKDTCHIDWQRPAIDIHNLVRGLSPYPAAWSDLTADGQAHGTMKIFTTALTDTPSTDTPGTVHISPDRRSMSVDTATVRLQLLSVQAPGKRRMDVSDFLRGCRLSDMKLS